MKRHEVTSSRRKQRKNHFAAPSSQRRRIMSCHLSKELREKHKVRALPIKRGDEVKILKGKAKGKSGKVVQVYRKKWVIYVDKVNREKQNGQSVFLPLKPTYCVIEKLHLNTDRKELIARRSTAAEKKEGKYGKKETKA